MINSTMIPKLIAVKVDNLRLRAYVGFLDWEKIKLQDVILSYSFKYDGSSAFISDNVEDAIDYKKLTKKIIKIVDNQSFQLIESLAELIYNTIIDFDPLRIEQVNVTVEKPHALRFADNVKVRITGTDRYNIALVALGSNINAQQNMEKALVELERLGLISAATGFITTKPLKFTEQDDFTNGAVLIHTKCSFTELRRHLKSIEKRLGRIRTENKNAPRTIDLDVLTYNFKLLDEKELVDLPFLGDFIQELQPEVLTKDISTISINSV